MEILLKNQNLSFHFNPFGGLDAEEIVQTIIPRFETEILLNTILENTPKVIELVGKKGRGKTTHLSYLHSCLEEKYPILLLQVSDKTIDVNALQTPIVFVDSIHHFHLSKRIQLYKKVQTVILTTHHRRFLEYRIAGKSYQSINFNSIEATLLKKLLYNRIQLALSNQSEIIQIDDKDIQKLIRKFGDDYRAILNYLYDEFQKLK